MANVITVTRQIALVRGAFAAEHLAELTRQAPSISDFYYSRRLTFRAFFRASPGHDHHSHSAQKRRSISRRSPRVFVGTL
jgi:hypothetical protein